VYKISVFVSYLCDVTHTSSGSAYSLLRIYEDLPKRFCNWLSSGWLRLPYPLQSSSLGLGGIESLSGEGVQ
jgi:hypothetical protein